MKNLKNNIALFALIIGILLTFSHTAGAQNVPDNFDPNANDTVRSIAVQTDGKILIGGSFTTLDPNGSGAVTRNRIARLNADGTLDASFDPNANATIFSIAVQTDGKILIGGFFGSLDPNGSGTVSRNSIARLNADGTVEASFDPNANDTVRSIHVQTDGKILIGGSFTSLNPNSNGAVTRNRIARFNADGTLDSSFNPNANDTVRSIAVQTDGKILIGGSFTTLNGGAVTRNRIARLGFAPTAAAVSISGRVSNGRSGVSRAIVHITDQNGNIRTARTTSFGYYRFTDVEVGQSLLVNVFHKRYQFSPQVVTVNDAIADLNFTAQ